MKLFTFFAVLLFTGTQGIESTSKYPESNNNAVIITNAQYSDTCLGALIHPLWVITSGTCALKTIYDDKRVFFSNAPLDFNNGTFIANIQIHPSFKEDPLDNDIAVIKLATPASKSIRTLKIPNRYMDDVTARKAISYGQYSYGIFNSLKISSVVMMNYRLCSRYPVSISSTRLCAYPAVGCEGDEGGPLILDNQLIGITSISPIQAALCNYNYCGCNSLFPVSTFTKLEPYRAWITNVTSLTII